MSRQIAARVKFDGKTQQWKFITLHNKERPYTYQHVWDGEILPNLKVPCRNLSLLEVFGGTKGSDGDGVSGPPDTDIIEAMESFELKFFTFIYGHDCTECRPIQAVPSNAFNLLMAGAQKVFQKEEEPIKDPNSKEKLQNTVLIYFKDGGCRFPKGSADAADKFLKKLTTFFYYVDGQFAKMADNVSFNINKANTLPTLFSGYNVPQLTKHRKRTLSNLSEERLSSVVMDVKESIQSQVFLKDKSWLLPMTHIHELLDLSLTYSSFLKKKAKQSMKTPTETPSEASTQLNVEILEKSKRQVIHSQLQKLDCILGNENDFIPISIKQHLETSDRKKIFYLLDTLKEHGISSRCVFYSIDQPGNLPNLAFLWKIPQNISEGDLLRHSSQIITELKEKAPKYLSKLTKKQFMSTYGFVTNQVALKTIFAELTGDQRKDSNLATKEISERFEFALLCEEPGINVDLRCQEKTTTSDTFELFFKETEKHLSEDVGTPVHERRHSESLYLAKAISMKDLLRQVQAKLPSGTPTPSVKWLRYQFQPRHPNTNAAKHYKARMNIKMMVQKRQVNINNRTSH